MNMCDVCYKHATKNTEVGTYKVRFIHPTKRGESLTRTAHLCNKCFFTTCRRVNVLSTKVQEPATV